MRILVVLILFLLGTSNGQQVSDNGNGYGSGNGNNIPTPTSDSEIRFHESQIRLADSLYKNYLPQSNFEEVKVAMEFFDSLNSCQSSAVSRHQSKFSKLYGLKPNLIDTLTYRLIDTLTYRLINFNCAKAHYYHAVGLTEKDDIVGACEHYLRALEIMENDDVIKRLRDTKIQRRKDKRHYELDKENYERIRFLSLVYTRLAELHLSENYYDMALRMYKKAVKYVVECNDTLGKTNILKNIGNAYQLSSNLDSALYYYNESLKFNTNNTNKLDLEKNIAYILFEKGERDSAYNIVYNNIEIVNNYMAKYSYYSLLGEMYYKDCEYDSSIVYLRLSTEAPDKHTRLISSTYLSAIYDSIGNDKMKHYCDSITLSILSKDHNRSIDITKLQDICRNYLENRQEIEREKDRLKAKDLFVKYIVGVSFFIVILVYTIFILRHRHRKYKNNKDIEISEKNKKIKTDSQIISDINNKLVKITEKYDRLKSEYDINKKNYEKNRIKKVTKTDIKNFCNCENSKKILANIDRVKNENLKINNLAALNTEELRQMLDDADYYMNDFTITITNKYPKLKEEDLCCICLLLLNIKGPTIAVLMGKEYNSIWSRIKKIYTIIGITSNVNIYKIFE